MAVPKNVPQKTKKKLRKSAWKRKIWNKVNKAFTLAKMIYKEETKQDN